MPKPNCYHTPGWLIGCCVNLLEGWGFSVKINSPFSGSIVPMRFYQQDRRVMSIMIEVNR